MGNGSSKSQLEAVAQFKFDDALLLFESGRFSNAFYLAGYAIECALKACIARQLLPEIIPDKKFVNAVYSHNFDALVGLAGLRNDLRVQQDADQGFQANWAVASEWSPEVRYEPIDKATAHLMVIAVGDSAHGVTVDKDLLVSSGTALVRVLDDNGLKPRAAMWVYNSDTDIWRLWIVPEKGVSDKAEFYRRLARII